MNIRASLLLLLAFVCYLEVVAAADKLDVVSYHAAVLVKNGKQTSCEIALIDGSSGFVAATCVVDANGAVDTSSRYEVYTDNYGTRKSVNAPILSGSIRVHPQFKTSSFANNIAIVQFSLSGNPKLKIDVAVDHRTWASTKFVRRSMSNLENGEWGTPNTGGSELSRSECAASSGLYSSNYFDFECSTDTLPSMVGSQCRVPYGALYGVINGKMGIGGIYSHSVIQGDSICDSAKTVHYFVLLSNFIAFAENVLGRGVRTLSTGDFMVQSDLYYGMEPEAFARADSELIIGGNVFNRNSGEAMMTANGAPEQENNGNTAGGQTSSQASNPAPGTSSAPTNPQPTPGNTDNVPTPTATSPDGTTDNSGNNSNGNGNGNNSNGNGNSNGNNDNSGNNNNDDSNDDGDNHDDDNNNNDDNNNEDSDNNNNSATADSTNNNSNTDGSNNSDGDDDSSASKSSTKRNPEDDGNAPTILSDRLRETDTFDKDSSNSDSSASNSDKNNDDHDASDVSNSSESGKGGKKLKGGQIAAIVICLILFFILAAVGGYYGLRWYREYRIKRWSPDAVREILDSHIVESEMGNAPQPRFDLPSYGNHRGTMFVAAGPNSHD
ncbi:hypothetical protein EV176_002125 [Coemansia sp. RSA 451]|nr:hypothetical protein EV176_002125 [Coemansia sp. RSA 451]